MGRRVSGFTLIELLVVVVIAAVLTGLAVLGIGNWRSADDPERHLQRFAALLEAQCDAALFQSRPRGVRLTGAGYDFWQAVDGGWAPVAADGVNRPRDWPGGLQPRLFIEGRRQALVDEDALPQIVCQPLGELTAFELELGVAAAAVRLTGSAGGRLEMHGGR